MAINPHRKGGSDVPVSDGGTGASSAGTALSNLGGLDSAAHAAIDHTGLPGIPSVVAAPQIIHRSQPDFSLTGGVPFTYALPANTLTQAGEKIQFRYGVSNSTGHGVSTHLAAFNGITVLSDTFGNPFNPDWYVIDVWFERLTPTTGRVWCHRWNLPSTGFPAMQTSVRNEIYSPSVGPLAWGSSQNFDVSSSIVFNFIILRTLEVTKYPLVP